MKKLSAIIIGLCCVLNLTAQQREMPPIESLYMSAPLKVCPMLTPQQRFELLENANIGQKDTIKNFLDGYSWVDYADLEKGHIIVHQTKQSSIELLYKDNQLLVIQTYYGPLPSSVVYIVDSQWSNRRNIPVEMADCENMPATFVSATISNDSLLLENHTLDQVYDFNNSIYRNCPRTKSIPLPL